MLKTHGFALRYNPALDGLRGVAIALVLLSHAHVPLFDGAFFGASLIKVEHGGWFPLALGLLVLAVMATWHRGRRIR